MGQRRITREQLEDTREKKRCVPPHSCSRYKYMIETSSSAEVLTGPATIRPPSCVPSPRVSPENPFRYARAECARTRGLTNPAAPITFAPSALKNANSVSIKTLPWNPVAARMSTTPSPPFFTTTTSSTDSFGSEALIAALSSLSSSRHRNHPGRRSATTTTGERKSVASAIGGSPPAFGLTISERAAASSEARRDCIELPPPISSQSPGRHGPWACEFFFKYLNK